ncbi:MAG: P-type conjugative transfer protein TrbJ, partial [Sphingobium sp.]|nr:P-type conjugative transfer protein TrbJ [Sphingobium sp.]
MLAAGAAVLSVSVSAMLPTAASAQIGGVVFDPR